MDEQKTVALIDAVQPQKFLWLKSHKSFKDKALKEATWQTIAEDIGVDDADQCKKRWDYVRDYYVKLKNKARKAPSGAGSDAGETWPYYASLSFLDKSLEPRPGVVSTMTQPEASQADLFARPDDPEDDSDSDDEALENYLFGDTTSVSSPGGSASSSKKRKADSIGKAFEKRFLQTLENTEKELTKDDDDGEMLFGKSVGKSLVELKLQNPAGADWAKMEISRILYQAKYPAFVQTPGSAPCVVSGESSFQIL